MLVFIALRPDVRAERRRRKACGSAGSPAGLRRARPQVEGLEGRALLSSITEYPITVGTSSPGNSLFGITGGPDGNVYFTDTINNAIGRITPSGVITELPLPPPSISGSFFKNGLDGITLGADNRLAFTESTQGAIGKIATDGSTNQYPIDPTGKVTSQGPDRIVAAMDGSLWWTEDGADAIGVLTPTGVFHQYMVPGATHGGIAGPSLKGIVAGSDGNIWFTNWGPGGDFIGRVSPVGNLTEFPLPVGTHPNGIASGPDGNLWFTAYGSNTIDVMSTSGTLLHQYPVPVPSGSGGLARLSDITVGPDNNLYFTEQIGNIGVITTAGSVTIIPVSTTVPTVPGASGPQPLAITSGPDGNIWFTDPWTNSIGVLRIGGGATGTVVQWSTASGGNGHYYQLVMPADPSGNFSWTQANAAATAMTHGGSPGYLATATSAAEDAFLASQFRASLPAAGSAWIGLRDDGRVGDWTWADGEPFSYANWAPGEPSSPGVEDWVGYVNGGASAWSWNDFQMNNYGPGALYGFLVEFDPPSVLSTSTGLTASAVSAAVGQSLTFTATVSDSAPGGELPTEGTVTFRDQTGILASRPLVNGVATFTTSSLAAGPHAVTASYGGTANFAPNSTGTALTVTIGATGTVVQWSTASGGNGHYYQLVMPADPSGNFSWTQANAAATAMTHGGSPGYLATATSAAEDAFLASQFRASLPAAGSAWIGLRDDGRVGDWTWADGEPFSYANWAPGEPSSPGVEDWVGYVNGGASAWSWNDFQMNNYGPGALYGFLVEFDPIGQAATATVAASTSTPFSPTIRTVSLTAMVTSVTGTVNEGTETFTVRDGHTVIGSAVTVNVVNGMASVDYVLPAGIPIGMYTIEAIYDPTDNFGGSSDSSRSLTVTAAAPAKLVVNTEPPSAVTAGQPLATPAQPITVYEVDAYGNLETGDNSTVVTVSLGSGSGQLMGTFTATVVGGVATFANLSDVTAETITLTFSGGNLTPATSASIIISPGTGARLVITQQPSSSAIAGLALGRQPLLVEEDQYGNVLIGDSTTSVTAARGDLGTSSLLGGQLTVKLVGGVAAFDGLSYNTAEAMNIYFASSAPGVSPVTSDTVVVAPSTPSQLVIHQQLSSTAKAGQPFPVQPIVYEEDQFGNLVTGDSTTQVSAVLAGGPGSLQGPTTVIVSAGVARFSGLYGNTAGMVTLVFSSGLLATAASSPVVIIPETAARLAVQTQPSLIATAGRPFVSQPVIAVEDRYGNIETGDNSTIITASLANGAGTLQGPATVTVKGGVATFTALAENMAGTIALRFTGGGLAAVSSEPVNVSAASATHLVVTTPPPDLLSVGQPFTLVVTAEDPYGNTDTSFRGEVTVSLPDEPGSTSTVQAQNGVATFIGLTVDVGANGRPIQVAGGGLATASTAPVTVNHPSTPPPTITGERVVMIRKTNKRGKPVGKAVLQGFTLDFSTPMNAQAAGFAGNYTVDFTSTRRIKNKKVTVLTPVAFTSSYDAASHSVTLRLAGRQTFANGGRITVAYSPPSGVSSAAGIYLEASNTQFTISPKARVITPG